VFSTTVAFPLSAGRMVRFTLYFRVFSAALSVVLKLSLGREEFFYNSHGLLSGLFAISIGKGSTASSTPVRMSSMGVECGVTAKLRPFCSSEYTASSSF